MVQWLEEWWRARMRRKVWERIISQQLEGIMANLDQVKAAIQANEEAAAAEHIEVAAKIGALTTKVDEQTAQILALREQLAQGGTVTPEALDEVVASLTALRGGIAQISEPRLGAASGG